jgi:hypothetical protein
MVSASRTHTLAAVLNNDSAAKLEGTATIGIVIKDTAREEIMGRI